MATNIVDKLRSFLSSQICLIAETSPALAMSLRTKLVELGVPNAQIHTTSKYDAARELLVSIQPTLFILEYELDPNFASELIALHERMHDAFKRTIIVTSPRSALAVQMEDRDGQIDSFLIKPFSADVFRERLISVAKLKVEPPPYVEKLNLGRTSLASGDMSDAMKTFEEASELTPKPTLAHFYKGQTSRKLGDQERALAFYREGLKVQPFHYRCALGEFETLTEMGRLEEAFALIGPLVERFPVSQVRLRQFFDLTVAVEKFEMLPSLYDVFREMETRSQDLIASVESAFLNAGRLVLAAGNIDQAVSYFETGIQVASRRFDYLETVIKSLVEKNTVDAAASMLTKVSPEDKGSPAFERLVFTVDQLTMSSEQLLNRGRQLIFSGHGTPEIFHIVVRSFAEAGKETLAESAIGKALETNPELRNSLYQLMAEHLPKRAA